MRQNDSTYNGWANHETWAVHLWLSNDEGSYYAAREAATSDTAKRELVESIIFGDEAPASLATDLLRGSLDSVDWSEIVAAFAEDNEAVQS